MERRREVEGGRLEVGGRRWEGEGKGERGGRKGERERERERERSKACQPMSIKEVAHSYIIIQFLCDFEGPYRTLTAFKILSAF